MDAKTALVTGGAGFIGSHLVDALLAKGLRVICLDNLITGAEQNLEDPRKSNAFTFVNQDVSQPFSLKEKADYVFHLASPASVIDYQKYPEETARVNTIGTINMLEYAKQSGAQFLMASTSEIYGDPKEHPQKETYWGNVNTNGIRSCYDESKRFGETITMVYKRKYSIDARIVRIFNTYGPRMRKTDGRVVSNLINQAIEGKPLTVYGDGSQTRSFCYVSDLVAGLMALMFTSGLSGEVVNIGNPEEYTMLDFAQKIKTLTKSNSEIIFEPLPTDDPIKRRPDIEKAEKLLGWKPLVTVDEGLKKTIEYYRSL